MRTTLLTILAFFVAAALQAKNITWHQGSVVLADRHVFAGEIARLSTDLLLHRSATGEVTTYPAHKVASFRYHDHAEDINRQFISVATRSGVAKSYKFYERVVLGKISVLRIQQSFSDLIDEANPDSFDFFVEKERKVCSIKQFRKKYFDQVKQELDAQSVSYTGLDPNTRLGAVSLIILYNQTTSASPVVSLN
jgi:hypothetical protein